MDSDERHVPAREPGRPASEDVDEIICPDCRGTGHSGNLYDELCPTCAGGKRIPRPDDNQMTAIALGQMAERVEAQWRKLSDHIADMKLPCQWFADAGGDYWVAACEGEHGELWCFDDNSSGPVENHMRFCPFCGHPVVVVATPQEPEDDA